MYFKNLNKEFGRNLQRELSNAGKTQADLAKHLNVSKAAVTNWCKGEKFPRTDKIDVICKYLGIKRSDLIMVENEAYNKYAFDTMNQSKAFEEYSYYDNDNTKKIAEEIRHNKELGLLFDAAKNASPDDLMYVHDLLLRLKRSESNEE